MTKEDAQALGTTVGNQALSSGPLTPNDLNVKGSTPSATENVWGAEFTGGTNPDQTEKVRAPSMIGVGNEAKTTAHTNFTSYNNDRAKQAEQATVFLTTRTNAKPILSSDDPIFRSVNVLKNNPTFASGSEAGCTQPQFTTNYVSDATYTCTQSYTTYTSSCRREAQPECIPSPVDAGCDAGGLVPGSWSGDMNTSFTPDGTGNYDLQFGTIGNNYWSGGVYDRTLTFQVTDLSIIKKFIFARARFDDYILVTVNDALVFVGPHGGDRLEATPYGVQFGPSSYGGWELGEEWDQYPNIDVMPHLKLGENKIFVRTMVGGKGESAVIFSTRQKCPATCELKWVDYCGGHEGLVQ